MLSATNCIQPLLRLFAKLLLIAAVLVTVLLVYFDAQIRQRFEGRRWSLPSHVYAKPVSLYQGAGLSRAQLVSHLKQLGYRPCPGDYPRVGQYCGKSTSLQIKTRGFNGWNGKQTAELVRMNFASQTIRRFKTDSGSALVQLEPLMIGGIYPAHREDRQLVQLKQVPTLLVEALLATEDRDFYEHFGISLKGIARALWVNISSGKTRQGGSTLTQQLVKNLFLTNQRTLSRKAQEAMMALLLEWHYSKAEILESYLNEVYLGQQGQNSINGFGLAARFYFGQPLEQLDIDQLALLAGMVKGPSWYNPRRHPDRALERRNLVLKLLAEQGKLTQGQLNRYQAQPLGLASKPQPKKHWGYLQLVKQQLAEDYREQDLKQQGLQIFTAMNPMIQQQAEKALNNGLTRLERQKKITKASLQGAVLVSDSQSAEVLALVPGRDSFQKGFNRALLARRPVGSLLKPAIYLAALEQGMPLYQLIDDQPVSLKMTNGETWQPANYDKKIHGKVMLENSLADSLNLASVRLGLDLGMPMVADSLQRLGLQLPERIYPSLLLGGVSYTPWQMQQMYQTIAGGGFYSPLRSVLAVTDHRGASLNRYPLETGQRFDEKSVYQLNHALQQVVKTGTARGLSWRYKKYQIAGKTGTTDDLRDSWFAGYSGNLLALVWLGRDDNKPAGLTGSSGALKIWQGLMDPLVMTHNDQPLPDGLQMIPVDAKGRLAKGCKNVQQLPTPVGQMPQQSVNCRRGILDRLGDLLGG